MKKVNVTFEVQDEIHDDFMKFIKKLQTGEINYGQVRLAVTLLPFLTLISSSKTTQETTPKTNKPEIQTPEIQPVKTRIGLFLCIFVWTFVIVFALLCVLFSL